MFALSDKRPPIPEELLAKLRPVTLAKSKVLPLSSPWRELFPGAGLRRGSTVVVQAAPGLGGLSVALSLLSGASARGHWAGVVGVDDPGVVAMADLGVDLRRVLFVPRPRGAWAESAADLIDGVDLLVVRAPSKPAFGPSRKLMDRVRERGAVLIALSEPAAPWPLPADVTLQVTDAKWHATSRLESRSLTIRIAGRGARDQHGERIVVLPSPQGHAEAS